MKVVQEGMLKVFSLLIEQANGVALEEILIVIDFLDVFSSKLTTLPLVREVEFVINVTLGTSLSPKSHIARLCRTQRVRRVVARIVKVKIY